MNYLCELFLWCNELQLLYPVCVCVFFNRRLFFGENEIAVRVPSLFKLLIKEVSVCIHKESKWNAGDVGNICSVKLTEGFIKTELKHTMKLTTEDSMSGVTGP